MAQGRHMSREPTAITPKPRTWFTDPKSLMSVFGVILLMAATVFFGRDYQRNQHYKGIIDAYEAYLAIENDESLDPEELQKALDRLEYRGTRFIDLYPDDGRIDEILAMIKDSKNLIAEDEYDRLLREFLAQQQREHDEFFNELRDTARQTILSLTVVSPTGPNHIDHYGFAITWTNRSRKTISEIYFYVEGFYDGVTVPTASGQATVRGIVSEPRPAGYRTESHWRHIWSEPVSWVMLHGVHITYEDGTSITLPPDVLDAIWER